MGIKMFENFDKKDKFIIGWGLSGGFGGINNYEVIEAMSLEEASKQSYYKAIEEYESLEGMHGLRTKDEIMEEDELGEEEAEYEYNYERENWLEYEAFPFSKEKAKEIIDNYGLDRF